MFSRGAGRGGVIPLPAFCLRLLGKEDLDLFVQG